MSLASKYGKAPVATVKPRFMPPIGELKSPRFDNRKFATPERAIQSARNWANKVGRTVHVWDCGDFFALSLHNAVGMAHYQNLQSHSDQRRAPMPDRGYGIYNDCFRITRERDGFKIVPFNTDPVIDPTVFVVCMIVKQRTGGYWLESNSRTWADKGGVASFATRRLHGSAFCFKTGSMARCGTMRW